MFLHQLVRSLNLARERWLKGENYNVQNCKLYKKWISNSRGPPVKKFCAAPFTNYCSILMWKRYIHWVHSPHWENKKSEFDAFIRPETRQKTNTNTDHKEGRWKLHWTHFAAEPLGSTSTDITQLLWNKNEKASLVIIMTTWHGGTGTWISSRIACFCMVVFSVHCCCFLILSVSVVLPLSRILLSSLAKRLTGTRLATPSPRGWFLTWIRITQHNFYDYLLYKSHIFCHLIN